MIRILALSIILLFSSHSNSFPLNKKTKSDKHNEFNTSKKTQQENLIDSGPFVGAVSDNSATMIVKPINSSTVKFQISEDSLFSNSFFTEETASDEGNYNFTKIRISTLNPDTKYFYRAVINENVTDRIHSFKTFPAEKNYSFSFGFGSCQQGYGATTPDIYPVIAADSLRFLCR